MKNWLDTLQQMDIGEIRFDESLARHTTFRIGGLCDALVIPKTPQHVAQILAFAKDTGIATCLLGGGSNVLASDDGFRGLVIKLTGLRTLEINHETIRVGAGLPLPLLAAKMADAHLGGLAFAAGIPGTVGGAVVMNAGAHGGQMSDFITEILYCTTDGQLKKITAKEAMFTYRSSLFAKEKIGAILEIEGRLSIADGTMLHAQMAQYKQERLDKQPQGKPCAGSVFKNPTNDAAGRLIEAIGAKGWRIGDAMVSEKHGNFIVNMGAATSYDVLQLIDKIRQKVWEQFAIKLEREIVLLDGENIF